MYIFIDETTLTDGSQVYAVRMHKNDREDIFFDAISEIAARELADAFKAAIEKYTNAEPRIY